MQEAVGDHGRIVNGQWISESRAHERHPLLLAPLIVLDQFPVKNWIGQVKAPVFVAHGTHDTSIHVHHGQAVYQLAPNKRGLWLVDGADHGDLWARGIWARADAFFTDVEKTKSTAAATN